MIKNLLLSCVLATSVAVTPSIQHSYTDYYRTSGDYESLTYRYEGLYTTKDNSSFDLILLYLSTPSNFPNVTYTSFGQTYTIKVIAFDGDTSNFDLDTFYWAITCDYDNYDYIDNCFGLLINPQKFSYKNYAFQYCMYIFDTIEQTFSYSYNTKWNNFNFNQWQFTYNDEERALFYQDAFGINSFSTLSDYDLDMRDYDTCVGMYHFTLLYGYDNGLDSLYQEGYQEGYDIGFEEGYLSGYQQGEAYGRSEGTNFYDLLARIADTPIIVFRSLFNVNIFGVNMVLVITSLLTLLILVWVVKKFFLS